MTRKDYEKFAAMFRKHASKINENSIKSYIGTEQLSEILANQLAAIILDTSNIFAEDNRNFNKTKFLGAIKG